MSILQSRRRKRNKSLPHLPIQNCATTDWLYTGIRGTRRCSRFYYGFGLRFAMPSFLAGSPGFPYIFRAIHSALNGDFRPFSGPTQTSQEILEASVGQPLICSDSCMISRFNKSITHSEIDCSRFPKDVRILQPLPRSGTRKRYYRNRNDSYLANLSKFPVESLRSVF